MSMQQFCLRWNNHQPNFISVFSNLLSSETLVDVTLAAEGRHLQAHKVVLSACSTYFQTLFTVNPCQHPIVILKDVKFSDLKIMVDFMYYGEVNISEDQLPSIIKSAESLKIKGLAEMKLNTASLTKRLSSSSEQGAADRGESCSSSPSPLSSSFRRKRLRKTSTGSTSGSGDKTEEINEITFVATNIVKSEPLMVSLESDKNVRQPVNTSTELQESIDENQISIMSNMENSSTTMPAQSDGTIQNVNQQSSGNVPQSSVSSQPPAHQDKNFAFVYLTNKNTYVEVPSSWLIPPCDDDNDDWHCWWPPKTPKEIDIYVKEKFEPDSSTWTIENVKIMNFFDAYEKARRVAAESDYVSSEEGLGRGCRSSKSTAAERQCNKKKRLALVIDPTTDEDTKDEPPKKQKMGFVKPAIPMPKICDETKSSNANTPNLSNTVLEHHPEIVEPDEVYSFENNNDTNHSSAQLERDSIINITAPNGNHHATNENILFDLNNLHFNKLENLFDFNNKNITDISSILIVNFKYILKLLSMALVDLKDLKQRLDQGHLANITTNVENIKQYFPIETKQELEFLEKMLITKQLENEFKEYVRIIGGKNGCDFLKNVFTLIYDDKFAADNTWLGKKNKVNLSESLINKYVRDVIQTKFSNFTNCDFNYEAGEWFRLGAQRYKRKLHKFPAGGAPVG